MVAPLPGVDHPDEARVGGDVDRGLVRSITELARHLGHLPAAGPAPSAQRPAVDTRHPAYLRVAAAHGTCSRVLPDVLLLVTIARLSVSCGLASSRWYAMGGTSMGGAVSRAGDDTRDGIGAA